MSINDEMEATVPGIPEGDEETAEEVEAAAAVVAASTPPKMDLSAFVAGVLPITREQRLYGNGGQRVDLDRIERQLNEAKARRQQAHVNRLEKERIAAIHALNSENVIDLTLVGWTRTKEDRFNKELTAEGVQGVLERNLRQTAAQTTAINGILLADGGLTDGDVYQMLLDLSGIPGMTAQIDRLVRIVAETNADPNAVSIPL